MKTWNLPRISPGVSDASICSWAMEDEGQTRFNVDTTSKSFMHRLSRTDLESWHAKIATQNLHFEELVDSLYFFSFVGGVIICVYLTSSLSSCHSVTSRTAVFLWWLGLGESVMLQGYRSHVKRAKKHIYRAITLNGFNPIHHYSSNWNQA